MKPRGLLMIEHRLIEKMLGVAKKELDVIKAKKAVDPVFIDTIVDFIRIYADRTHHGKEEDILFKELENKKLDGENVKLMKDLVDEHMLARKIVGELVEANQRYAGGDLTGIGIIADRVSFLTDFYPRHIAKEDKAFFPNTERYFSDKELDAMLAGFYEFDRKMIHEKYNRLYESLKNRYS